MITELSISNLNNTFNNAQIMPVDQYKHTKIALIKDMFTSKDLELLAEAYDNAQIMPVDQYKHTKIALIKDMFTSKDLELLAEAYDRCKIVDMPAQKELGRKQITDFSPVLKFIQFNNALLNKINELMGSEFSIISPVLWEDAEGYELGIHKDTFDFTDYGGAMQVYLPSTCQQSAGTRFYRDANNGFRDYVINVPFIPNSGYICADSTNITHSSGLPVEAGLFRRSIYFILS